MHKFSKRERQRALAMMRATWELMPSEAACPTQDIGWFALPPLQAPLDRRFHDRVDRYTSAAA
jgi:hypothetical protein